MGHEIQLFPQFLNCHNDDVDQVPEQNDCGRAYNEEKKEAADASHKRYSNNIEESKHPQWKNKNWPLCLFDQGTDNVILRKEP